MENKSDESYLAELTSKLKLGPRVILLRHAESQSNQIRAEIASQDHTDDDVIRAKTFSECIDSSITTKGVKQCENASEVTSKLNVGVVLVSPMKRALETAYHMFKNHPNFKKIEFIVVPKLKE